MKTKHILFTMATAALFAACTNDEFETTSGDYSNLPKIDASDYALVSVPNSSQADTRLVAIPGYEGEDGWVYPAPEWVWGQKNDAIGFSLIYPSDQCLTTNYRFYIKDAADIREDGNATFRTDETTIFGGDYFVYYPYNEDFKGTAGDASIGIPFELDAIQAQITADPIKASDKPNLENLDPKFTTAVKHLNEFRISNRVIGVKEGVQQSEFSTNRYTATLNFQIYPVNQTKTIAVKRIEMVCDEGFVVKGKFQAEKDVNEPQFVEDENGRAKKIVLTFNNLKEDADQNGLEIAAGTKEEDAYMGYMSVCPGTYSNVKFSVYYTETGNMKRVEFERESLTFKENYNYRMAVPVNANGAKEVTSYEIYSESEFAAAVKKSNAMNEGTESEAVFTLMDDITLTGSYKLDAKVPVTFEGGKTITLARSEETKQAKGISLHITSNQRVVINNTIKGGDAQYYDIKVGDQSSATNNPDVTIAAVQSETLHLTCDRGTLTVNNETEKGTVASLYNRARMVVKDATVKGNVESTVYQNNVNDKPVISLTSVDIEGSFTNYNGGKVSTLNNVTVAGSFTNASNAKMNVNNVSVTGAVNNNGNAVMNVEGPNNFGAVKTPLSNVKNAGTINLAGDATMTLGTVTESGVMNIDGEAVAKGATTMTGLMTLNGTYTAEGDLNDLTQDHLDLEGTLNTKGTVDLETPLEICGVINNSGSWTLGKDIYVKQRNHAHSVKNAEFNNSCVVTVEGVETTSSPAINNMPRTLYKKVENGRLIWRGMKKVADINDFVEMNDCWATDFNAVLEPNTDSSEDLNESGDWDWSSANVIIDNEQAGAGKTTTLNIKKPLNVNNLSINLGTIGKIETKYTGIGYGLIITELFSLTGGFTTFDAGCLMKTKDLYVQATKTGSSLLDKLVVYKANKNIHYTGTYTKINGDNVAFVDGDPKQIGE